MAATTETIYEELKHLRAEIQELKNILVPEIEPDNDEIRAIQEGEVEFKTGECIDWKTLKSSN